MLEVAVLPAFAVAAVIVIVVGLYVTNDDDLSMALVAALAWALVVLALSSLAVGLSFFLRVEFPVAVVGVLTGGWLLVSRGWILGAGSMLAVLVAGHAAGIGALLIGVVAAALLLDRLLSARAARNERAAAERRRAAAERRREAQLREILLKWAAQRHEDPELDERLKAADWRPEAPLEESRATYLAVWHVLAAERRARGERVWSRSRPTAATGQ